MLNIFARASVSRVTDPIGAWLVRRGLTPNSITVLGTIGSVAATLWFFPRGQLFIGTIAVTAFVLFDLLDGAMARAQGSGTPFGAVLDASCDRIADGALFAALAWYAFDAGHRWLAVASLVSLVSAQVVSYVKARAEASGLSAEGGIAERADRLIITLVGSGLSGLGVPYVLDVALWLCAVLTAATVVQRLLLVHRSATEVVG
ncbi:MAG: phosphatidylinositol phosphate synthase [Umezawaea sp.]